MGWMKGVGGRNLMGTHDVTEDGEQHAVDEVHGGGHESTQQQEAPAHPGALQLQAQQVLMLELLPSIILLPLQISIQYGSIVTIGTLAEVSFWFTA